MIPSDASSITAEWLGPFVGPLRHINVTTIGEGFGFGGTTFRVHHQTGSVIVKLATAERTRREQAFYEQCAPSTPIPTVRFFGAAIDGDEGAIVLEDLCQARQGDVLAGCSPQDMVALARSIGRVHGRWWGDSAHLGELGPRSRMTISGERLALAADRFKPPPVIAERMTGIADRFDAVCDALDAQPKTVTHRDFHLDNVLFTNEPIVIDWQLAAVGPPAVDAARLLIEVRPNDAQPDDAAAAIDAYLSELPNGVRPSRHELLDWMEPAFDLAIAGFSNWLGSPEIAEGRMAALQAESWNLLARGVELAGEVR